MVFDSSDGDVDKKHPPLGQVLPLSLSLQASLGSFGSANLLCPSPCVRTADAVACFFSTQVGGPIPRISLYDLSRMTLHIDGMFVNVRSRVDVVPGP
jgi:hypothetical protein